MKVKELSSYLENVNDEADVRIFYDDIDNYDEVQDVFVSYTIENGAVYLKGKL